MASTQISQIDKFTKLLDNIAVSGQPSQSQIKFIRSAGYQLVLRVKIEEIEPPFADERDLVLEQGLLYEEVVISYTNPSREAFEKFANILNQYQRLNIYVHCTAGYCTSGLLIPYLMLYKNCSKSEARNKMIVSQFTDKWDTFIDNVLAEHRVETS